MAVRSVGARSDLDVSVRRLMRFTELLSTVAIPRGYLGPEEGERLLDRHVLEAIALSTLLPQQGITFDVGSGAGLPGVPLACVAAERVVLVEAQVRRVQFLREVVADLALTNVEVIHGRAEELGAPGGSWRESASCGLARALAAPRVALELVVPFVEVGGLVCLPVSAETDVRELEPVIGELGGGEPMLVDYEVPGADERRWAMIVHKTNPTPQRYPRRPGVPARRPLGGGASRKEP